MKTLTMILHVLRRPHRDERGSAMTEFVMFLPVWVVLFVAVGVLGKIGMESTKVPLTVQKKLWDQVIPVSSAKYTDIDTHVSAPVAGGKAVTELGFFASAADTVESGVMGFLAASGHWGESFARVEPLYLLGDLLSEGTVPEPFMDYTEVIGDSTYAGYVVSDSTAQGLLNAEGGMDIVLKMLGGTGIIHSKGAGIRYGAVFAKESGYNINLPGNQTITVKGSYDVLVAPAPLTGAAAQHIPWAMTRLLAETQDNYNVALRFSEMEWTDQAAELPEEFDIDPGKEIDKQTDDGKKDAEKEAKKKCKNKCNTITLDLGDGQTSQFYCPNYDGSTCGGGETCNQGTGACISNNP